MKAVKEERMSTWKGLLAALTLAAPIAFAGIPADAQEAQKVNFYTNLSEPIVKGLEAALKKDHPELELVTLRLVTGNLAARFYNEATSGVNEADVIFISTTEVFDKYPEFFRPLAGIPAFDKWPEKLKEPIFAKTNFALFSIYYNTNLVKEEEAPTSWQSLLDPKFKGQLVLMDPKVSPTYMSFLLTMRDRFGDDYLKKLGAQDIRLSSGGLDGAQSVASGAAAVAAPIGADFAIPLIAQGAPLKTVTVGNPTISNMTSIAIPAKAPHPKAAETFFEWFLSDAAQSVLCHFGQVSGAPNVPGCSPLPDDLAPPVFGIPQATADELMALLGR